jgi:hypothetical protein
VTYSSPAFSAVLMYSRREIGSTYVLPSDGRDACTRHLPG